MTNLCANVSTDFLARQTWAAAEDFRACGTNFRMRFRPTPFSRRQFLTGLGGAVGWNLLPRLASGSSKSGSSKSEFVFSEIAPSASGITWVHNAAKSVNKYLPESTGPGCAFLDYDNDGWMDIYLVNSGKSDFYTPSKPLRNALYRNNRDGTFTDVTEKAGVTGGGFGMGVAVVTRP